MSYANKQRLHEASRARIITELRRFEEVERNMEAQWPNALHELRKRFESDMGSGGNSDASTFIDYAPEEYMAGIVDLMLFDYFDVDTSEEILRVTSDGGEKLTWNDETQKWEEVTDDEE